MGPGKVSDFAFVSNYASVTLLLFPTMLVLNWYELLHECYTLTWVGRVFFFLEPMGGESYAHVSIGISFRAILRVTEVLPSYRDKGPHREKMLAIKTITF